MDEHQTDNSTSLNSARPQVQEDLLQGILPVSHGQKKARIDLLKISVEILCHNRLVKGLERKTKAYRDQMYSISIGNDAKRCLLETVFHNDRIKEWMIEQGANLLFEAKSALGDIEGPEKDHLHMMIDALHDVGLGSLVLTVLSVLFLY